MADISWSIDSIRVMSGTGRKSGDRYEIWRVFTGELPGIREVYRATRNGTHLAGVHGSSDEARAALEQLESSDEVRVQLGETTSGD